MEICQQKDERITKLQAATSSAVEDASRDVNAEVTSTCSDDFTLMLRLQVLFQRALVESIRLELLELRQSCGCVKRSGGAAAGGVVNCQHHAPREEETGQRGEKHRMDRLSLVL